MADSLRAALMDLQVSGRVAVVTGGSRGLGRAVAETLAAEGCRVAVLARDAAACAEVATAIGGNAIAVAVDLASRQSIAAAFAEVRERLGPPAILVYNNSGAPDSFFDEAADEDYLEAFQLLVMGLSWCAKEVIPAMSEAGWGRIVTLGSICAKEPHRDLLPMVLHNITRPAQLGLSKTLANELGASGITVNTIGIGPFAHDGTARLRAYKHLQARGVATDGLAEARLKTIPLGRNGRADELAALTAFLCSEKAGFITGQTVFIDGGLTRSLY
jgi:3-oxoacyl-[acyl-carrier protein] reductase